MALNIFANFINIDKNNMEEYFRESSPFSGKIFLYVNTLTYKYKQKEARI